MPNSIGLILTPYVRYTVAKSVVQYPGALKESKVDLASELVRIVLEVVAGRVKQIEPNWFGRQPALGGQRGDQQSQAETADYEGKKSENTFRLFHCARLAIEFCAVFGERTFKKNFTEVARLANLT